LVASQQDNFSLTAWIEKKQIGKHQQVALHLTPPIKIENLLPCSIRYQLIQDSQTKDKGFI
jgi:hypothetical protein